MTRFVNFSVLVLFIAHSGSRTDADIISFQQGVDSGFGVYGSASDVTIASNAPNTADASQIFVDHSPATWQALLKFDNIFGGGAGQVALGTTIDSATLTLDVFNNGSTNNRHRMLADWNSSLTWNTATLNGNGSVGIQADGLEASAAAVAFTGAAGTQVFDVTADVQAWSDGQSNFGWAFLSQAVPDLDGWGARSSSFGTLSARPQLTVTFNTAAVPEPSTFTALAIAGLGFFGYSRRRQNRRK